MARCRNCGNGITKNIHSVVAIKTKKGHFVEREYCEWCVVCKNLTYGWIRPIGIIKDVK